MRLSLHSLPSRPLRSEGGPQTSRLADLPIAGYRRQIAFRTPGAHGQDRDLGTVVSVLHRGAKLFKVQTDISRNRNHQAYAAEGYQLSVAYKAGLINFPELSSKC